MSRLLVECIIKDKYNLDPNILRILFETTELIKHVAGDNTLELLLDRVLNELSLQKNIPNTEYHRNNRLHLIAHEIYIRMKRAVKDNNLDQVEMFLHSKLTLYNLGKTNVEHSIIDFDCCISCGNKLRYNATNKKFNCDRCGCEFQS